MNNVKVENDNVGRILITNLFISKTYNKSSFCFIKSDFLSAFSYWVVLQSPYDTPDINDALKAFNDYISEKVFMDGDVPVKLSYEDLNNIINSKVFESIPEIEILNHAKIPVKGDFLFVDRYSEIKPDYDFIDLGALARNIFYMLIREKITSGFVEMDYVKTEESKEADQIKDVEKFDINISDNREVLSYDESFSEIMKKCLEESPGMMEFDSFCDTRVNKKMIDVLRDLASLKKFYESKITLFIKVIDDLLQKRTGMHLERVDITIDSQKSHKVGTKTIEEFLFIESEINFSKDNLGL